MRGQGGHKAPPPWVSEGGDSPRKQRLLRPRTELRHRVEAVGFLRSTTPMETRVQSLIWEYPTCRGATKSVHNYCNPRA